MTLLVFRFILILVLLGVIGVFIALVLKTFFGEPKKSGVVRNYEKRFDPSTNKYYIVNVLPNKEEPICTWYGRSIKYKNLVQVEYVLEKLNEVK